VLDLFNEASGQRPGLLLAHGSTLFLIEAPQALLDQPRVGLNVEGVLGDLSKDA
jgi:hypothetical protein